ncbi:uncharacterized protein M6B38_361180 [Iris pallida]|uniref:COP1-interacting protein 7 n=1 Tax=Iris pallida TaxID=29817 RepID=A0AAX6GKC3_IRIPA|nr:uncharacterized protein M6B38_361180 [Iris pallida]
MRADARLDSAVFQLTPTRTRCDLVIVANGKTEKIASGLLNPFLAHLKAAKDQIAKGGYSISLEPDPMIDAPWFTKGTVERFVRFVSTPEVLERVSTIESEISQIEEAITIQGNENIGLSTVEGHQITSLESIEGSKPVFDADAEKAIVLYKPGSQPNPPDSNGSTTQEENSKIQLLRVLETRKIVLQKEQGMAFARATAAGFDMDHVAYLISFAERFGASRLKQACLQFMELWKVKHETGQWLEVEAVDLMSSRSGFSPFNASGIVLPGDTSKQNEFGEAWATKSNGDDLSDLSRDKRPPSDPQIAHGSHEYFQGQFQQPRYPSWPMHLPPGPHGFAPYPVQGMPYYQNYPGTGPFYQPPYPPAEDPRFGTPQSMDMMRRHSMNSKDSNIDSQDDGLDEILSELEKEGSRGRKSHKRISRSGKKKSGTVVIENLNYISAKRHESSSGESQSVSGSESGEKTEGALSDTVERKYKKSSRSSKKKGQTKSLEKSNTYDNDDVVNGQDADSGNWQAFQSFLLKAEERMSSTVDGDMFAGEKEAPTKRKQNVSEVEPILAPDRNYGDIQEARIMEFDSVDGKASRSSQAASNDNFLSSSERRGLRDSHLEPHFNEIEGGGGRYKRVASDDFVVYGRENPIGSNITLDPLGDHEYERPANLEKGSYAVTDDSFMVPVRSGSQDQLGTESRTDINIDLDFPSSHQRKEDSANKAKIELRYEPDDLTLMPERPIEREYIGYDPALDYDMQIPVNVSVKEEESGDQEDVSASKEELRESEKEKKLKVQDGLEKRKKDAIMRRGISSKTSPLTEAQKRAEKLRAYKVDLQKAKKENEEEQRKRLEALKLERQKRIAARSGSNTAQSPSATKQTRNRMPTKLSPSSFKDSKFRDSEPSSHSSLTKLPIRSTSIGSNDSQRIMKPSSTTDGLSRSVSSLPELKKESNCALPEAKVASARLRRLSEPKVINTQHASHKSGSTNIPKRSITSEPQMKISAIMQLDKTKSATLPELKIRTARGPSDTIHNKLKTEALQKGAGSKTSPTSPTVPGKKTDEKLPRVSYSDDNPVIEKTVVMLDNETITAPVVQAPEGMASMNDSSVGEHRKGMTGLDSDYAAVRAPTSPVVMGEIEDPNHGEDGQTGSYEVVNDIPKDESQFFSHSSVTENLYQAPYARATSLEDPSPNNLEYSGTPAVLNSGMTSVHNESVKARVSSFSDSSPTEQTHESSEKPRSKESKGFRKLLKFGKKSHTSSSGEGNIGSDGLATDDQAEAAPSNDVHILKNLISQDDSHAGDAPPKAHRSFSILSPFRSSKTSEKKMAA